ncbi:MAG: ribosome maturation factor RimP [Ruminococcaceae bacterium]|nr:ribosome maturation factor RimP [Oscillospiraceae bacterium]
MAKENSAKKAKNIAELVAGLIREAVEECGCTLWDVELVKEGSDLSLVISIDKEGGVSLEDCEMVNDAIDPIIEEADPIDEGYYLEVSSAGLERELSKPEHIRAYIGSEVSIKLYAPMDGRKNFEGTLAAYDEENKTVTVKEGENETVIELSKIAVMKNTVEF